MPSPANGTGGVLNQGYVATSAGYLYGPVGSGNQQVELRGVVFSNESASATTVTYGVGKSGTTVGAAGTSSGKTAPIGAAGATSSTIDASELEYMILGPGDYVWASAAAGTAVAFTVDGIVYS
jgi:hypothetical protein